MSDLCPVAVSQDSIEDEYQQETVGESNLLLLQQKKYCNVTFTFPNRPDRVEAHKFCLKARSPVFAKIFRMRKSGNVKGKDIEITESTPETFQRFLDFIYADKFDVSIAGALDLLQLSQKYKVHPLVKKCEELLQTKIQVEDSVKVFEAARRYGRQDLMDRAGEIMVKSFFNLIETETLANAEEETLVYLLERNDLNIKEVELFQLILNWGKIQIEETGDEQSLKAKLKNVISKIRYTNMTLFEFTNVVVPTGLLSAEESLSVYSYFGGNETTRAALKIQFNTTGRIGGKVEKFVDFFADKKLELRWVPFFRFQSLYFKVYRPPLAQVATKEWSDCLQKTAVISRIKLQWPQIRHGYERSTNLNVSISIVEFSGSRDINNFSRFLFQTDRVGCKPGTSDEIDVKPPVELILARKYAVVVKNLSDSLATLDNEPLVYYGRALSPSECRTSRDLLLGTCCLDLKEVHMETEYLKQNLIDSRFNLVPITGITVELV